MTPRELIDTARIPGAPAGPAGEMRLFRRGPDHMILVDRDELMSSRMNGSEEALATMACDRLGARVGAARMLIGGYGMGFTLRAALRALGPGARITVAELVPRIIDWALGPMAAMTGGCLDDPRVAIAIGDVADHLGPRAGWDAVLLDVDNGPDGLVRSGNGRLYSAAGLAAARGALNPGGVLAVWSAAADPAFARRLAQAGFAVDEARVAARQNGKGPRHTIWFATPR